LILLDGEKFDTLIPFLYFLLISWKKGDFYLRSIPLGVLISIKISSEWE